MQPLEIDRSGPNPPASGLEADRVMFVETVVRYQCPEESRAFARDQLPVPYQTLFRPRVRFGNPVVEHAPFHVYSFIFHADNAEYILQRAPPPDCSPSIFRSWDYFDFVFGLFVGTAGKLCYAHPFIRNANVFELNQF